MFGKSFTKMSLDLLVVAALSCCAVGHEAACAQDAPAKNAPEPSAKVQAVTTLPATRAITKADLSKLPQLEITVEDNTNKVTYKGVPLRAMFIEMMPEHKLVSMKEWKALSREELVVEVKGEDGYPGLVTALELAMNKSGDRFILATERDGKDLESGIQLICKSDEAHSRWVHQVASVRIVSIGK